MVVRLVDQSVGRSFGWSVNRSIRRSVVRLCWPNSRVLFRSISGSSLFSGTFPELKAMFELYILMKSRFRLGAVVSFFKNNSSVFFLWVYCPPEPVSQTRQYICFAVIMVLISRENLSSLSLLHLFRGRLWLNTQIPISE